jgi:LemA protein
MNKQAIKSLVIILVFIFVIVLGAIALDVVLMHNKLVKAEQKVEEAKAQVEVLCQRRLDLIPNIVETVKAYAKHEKETFTAVISARSRMQDVLKGLTETRSIDKEQMEKLNTTELQLNGSLMTILALSEKYPTLKANMNFITLQDQLEGTENRISVERHRYNTLVRFYNTKTATFPSNIVASAFGFEKKEFFEAAEEAKKAEKVEF